MTKPLSTLFLVAVLSTAAGCDGDKENEHGANGEGNSTYYRIPKEDEASMDAAIERAKQGVDQFIVTLGEPKVTQSGFSIKKGFPWNDGSGESQEHIWLTDVTYKDGKFHALVGNEPVNLKDVKLGDEVVVDKSEVSDWMYIEDGLLMGGYTLRELRAQMNEEERKQFDASVPFKIKEE